MTPSRRKPETAGALAAIVRVQRSRALRPDDARGASTL